MTFNSAPDPLESLRATVPGQSPKARREPVMLASQDLVAIVTLALVSILIICALTQQPLWLSLLGCGTFLASVALYVRIVHPQAKQNTAQVSRVSSRQAASVGEARLADGFEEAVIIIGQQQRIEHANPAARRLLGITNPFMPVTTVVRNPDVIDMINRVLSGQNCEPVTYQVDTPVDKYFRTLASPISANFGDDYTQRALVVFYDVTDIVRANDLRSDFLANASHELKTPVASLLGYIETMQGHAKDDKEAQGRFLKIMQQQAERMQRLIDDLLSLRRIELSEHIAPTDKADLAIAVEAAIQAVAPLAERRDVEIRLSGTKPAMVTGVHDQLVQLALNLIANALHISAPGAHLKLTLEYAEDWRAGQEFSGRATDPAVVHRRICTPIETRADMYRLRIQDFGRGFDREHIPRIGERFYRVAGDRENKERGTGLGLAIVKHIVLGHRGGLYVESARGVGTEFTVLLPANHKR